MSVSVARIGGFCVRNVPKSVKFGTLVRTSTPQSSKLIHCCPFWFQLSPRDAVADTPQEANPSDTSPPSTLYRALYR
jgi:hypothetical protein